MNFHLVIVSLAMRGFSLSSSHNLNHMTKLILSLFITLSLTVNAKPLYFQDAKTDMRNYVYHDQTNVGTFYCGCDWRWTGRSGGRTNLASCGYIVRAEKERAERIEWEHIVPASNFGRARQCWQKGGRDNCKRTDSVFNAMEADIHNLAPAIGEVNGNRSNYNFGVVGRSTVDYGQCQIKIDFKNRVAEPPDSVKGQVARIYFYMHDRYNLSMSRQQQQLYMAWDKQFPVTDWERLRDSRIAKIMGFSNPFVTGEMVWRMGHKNSGDGFKKANRSLVGLSQNADTPDRNMTSDIRGNKRSGIYHIEGLCPGFESIGMNNRIEFSTEDAAISSGFRKAKNCN